MRPPIIPTNAPMMEPSTIAPTPLSKVALPPEVLDIIPVAASSLFHLWTTNLSMAQFATKQGRIQGGVDAESGRLETLANHTVSIWTALHVLLPGSRMPLVVPRRRISPCASGQ